MCSYSRYGYSSRGNPRINRLRTALQKRGFEVWVKHSSFVHHLNTDGPWFAIRGNDVARNRMTLEEVEAFIKEFDKPATESNNNSE